MCMFAAFARLPTTTIHLCFVVLLLLVFGYPRATKCQKVLDNLSCDFNEDTLCDWSFSGGETSVHFEGHFNCTECDYDAEQDQVLVLRPSEASRKDGFLVFSIRSPTFTSGDYGLAFSLNSNFVGSTNVIVRQDANTESQILKLSGNRQRKWENYSIKLPKFINISVSLEIKFEPDQINFESDYLAINNLNIVDKKITIERCDYKCNSSEKCLSNDAICNLQSDCPEGDDEQQHCDKLPTGSYCTFDHNLCSWFNFDNANSSSEWVHVADDAHQGYLGVIFKGVHRFGAIAFLKSPVFEPVPLYHSIVSSDYYKSCKARFSYRFNSPSIELSLELEPQVENEVLKPIMVWRYFNKNKSFNWEEVTVSLPIDFHHRYRLKYSSALGLKRFSASERVSVAIENFSLSKECFAIDVPESEPRVPAFIPSVIKKKPFLVPRNKSIQSFTFTSCGAEGKDGPSFNQCERFYSNTSARAAILENSNISVNSAQVWTVPITAFYSIFARGADGGTGLNSHPGGKGALVRAVFFLQEGDTIFMSIGQSGTDACSMWTKDEELCQNKSAQISQSIRNDKIEVGGGGGGATYLFKYKVSTKQWMPLLIAGGGGGGSGKIHPDFKHSNKQHGKGFDYYNIGLPGNGEGSGGGWNSSKMNLRSNQTGKSLLDGAEGGSPCNRFAKWHTFGGFGGGGGGCKNGGGGGGFHGGSTNKMVEAGDGGTSYVDFSQSHMEQFSNLADSFVGNSVQFAHKQSGLVVAIPQIEACCNDGRFACLITGQLLNGSQMKHCICGNDHFMADLCVYERPFYLTLLWITLCILIIVFLLFFSTFMYIQKRSSKQKQLQRNESNDLHLLSNSTDVQLSRLRNHNILTEYNPNYEFGGSTCSLQDLNEITRDKLSLVNPLGQGAFGEVYQGFLRNMPGEVTDELPVAIKTLPEHSASKQAEFEFLMEALIMSKFKHKNIIRFIGICFEKMPRFIVLELLPGGDLKTFLRENRSTMRGSSPLIMGDLLVMALDVASGCQYLEGHHFIHRDIAARNCLLSSKSKMPSSINSDEQQFNGTFDINNYKNGYNNSGIVVKIADFGMARDIYRADYYRKGGKAMLPVKWMPPEAFLDGVFTSKTDVWSFGVLLWEVMSMGYMPYPGRGNQEVMQLVTAGGRLEPPNSHTPPQVYAIMTQCWNSTPEFRPNFATIIERIGYCLQDPDVLKLPLPIFHRSASVEKDLTLMRPPPDATDYLVPNNPGSQTNSNYSMATEKTELLSPDTCSTMSCANDDKLMELEDHQLSMPDPNKIKFWNDEVLANQMMPFNMNINPLNSYPSDHSRKGNPLNQGGIVLNPNSLANYHQLQPQPCVRYVNVNVNNDSFGGGGFGVGSNPNLDNQTNETNRPVNC